MKFGLAALGVLLFLSEGLNPHRAQADEFAFTYTAVNSVNGSSYFTAGTLITNPISSGSALVTGITGQFNGIPISGLLAPGTYQENNNILYYPGRPFGFNDGTFLDGGGVSFTAGALAVNIFQDIDGTALIAGTGINAFPFETQAEGLFTLTPALPPPTTYNFPSGGSITYSGPLPATLGSTGYDVSTTAPVVSVSGATLTQTDPTHPALVIDQNTTGPLSVTFTGTASSITGANTALDVYHVGPTQTGDVSLDTKGTLSGNTFAGGSGYGIDVEADYGNATIALGPDAISSVGSDGVRVDVSNGNATLTTAANITAGHYGINANADSLSIIVSGSVSGTQRSVNMDSLGHSALILETGATLTGVAVGSTESGATNALFLEGTGTTNNRFVFFNTLDVFANGIWALNGVSTIGATRITSGNLQIGDAAHPSARLTSAVTLAGPAATLSGHGTVAGSVINNNGGTISPGGSIGTLAITGNFQQTGGQIVFEIDPNGSGGFLESKLLFDPGKSLSINGADIIFNFLNGADPLAFYNSGLFNINTFFALSNGDPFSGDYNLGLIFTNDSFDVTAPGFTIDSFTFTPQAGATALTETANAVPEPVTLSLFGAGIAGVIAMRRKRSASVASSDPTLSPRK